MQKTLLYKAAPDRVCTLEEGGVGGGGVRGVTARGNAHINRSGQIF